MKTIIGAISLLIASALPTQAVTITNDMGGATAPYHKRYKVIARSGQRVVIDGPCYSACTLVFTHVPANRICATSRAVLGVHKFWRMYPRIGLVVDDPSATAAAVRHYPRAVQDQIARRGGYGAMPVNGYWYLRGPELGLRPC